MANSLIAKISKLRHDGNITDAEYQELINNLDGHDKQIRADAIDELVDAIFDRLPNDMDAMIPNSVLTVEISYIAEGLKEGENNDNNGID